MKGSTHMLERQDLRLCRQRTAEVEAVMISSQEVCRPLVVSHPCTLCLWMHQQPLTMTHCTCAWCVCTALKWIRQAVLARVYCWLDSGWRRALKKQELKNTLFWWGGCSCGFVIAITIRGPDRFPVREGRREEKVCYSTLCTKGENRGGKRCGCLAMCLSALFPSPLYCPPSQQLTDQTVGGSNIIELTPLIIVSVVLFTL